MLKLDDFPLIIKEKIVHYICSNKAKSYLFLEELKKKNPYLYGKRSKWNNRTISYYNRRRLDNPDIYFGNSPNKLYTSLYRGYSTIIADCLICSANGNTGHKLPDRYFYSNPDLNHKFRFSQIKPAKP